MSMRPMDVMWRLGNVRNVCVSERKNARQEDGKYPEFTCF